MTGELPDFFLACVLRRGRDSECRKQIFLGPHQGKIGLIHSAMRLRQRSQLVINGHATMGGNSGAQERKIQYGSRKLEQRKHCSMIDGHE